MPLRSQDAVVASTSVVIGTSLRSERWLEWNSRSSLCVSPHVALRMHSWNFRFCRSFSELHVLVQVRHALSARRAGKPAAGMIGIRSNTL